MRYHIVGILLLGLALSIAPDRISAQTATPTSPPPARLRAATPSASAASAPLTVTPAATPAEFAPGQVPAVPGSPAAAAAAQPAPADPKAEEAQKKAQRLQKIRQLAFDRRPSAILGAWATPPEDPNKPAEAAKPAAPSDPDDPDEPSETPGEKPAAAAPDPFDLELKSFQRMVTLGNWREVKAFLKKLDKEEGLELYKRLLAALRQLPPNELPPEIPAHVAAQLRQQLQQAQQQGQRNENQEKHVLSFDDIIAMAAACPGELDNTLLTSLGALVRTPLEQGHVVAELRTALEKECELPTETAVFDRRKAARLLFAAGQEIEAGHFLPSVEEAEEASDHEALNLLSRHCLALHRTEKKVEHLERAWRVTQAVLASKELKKEEKDPALARAVELAPKVKEELGARWLEESFTQRPERGMEIIAAIGAGTSQGLQLHQRDSQIRLHGLQLQTTAVEALLKAAPERAAEWRSTLELLAGNWLREAVYSYQNDRSTSMGPRIQRDPFGNIFYFDEEQFYVDRGMQQRGSAIKTSEVLEIRPSDAWLETVPASLRPKFDMIFAQLYLKVTEEDKAFPYIERLAKQYPELAKDLVHEFLRLWTQNHDPNATRNRTNVYMYMFGFERKAESIPLTRSKQERNLRELSALVPRLKAIAGDKLDQSLLAKAFTTCHSSAEVYRLDAIEQVFGPIAELKPKMLAELIQQMRGNLAGLWRQPALQEQAKTKRRQKDIQAEVMRGYQMSRAVVENALKQHPDEWPLVLALAALDHDENNYQREIKADSQYTERRLAAFERFARAAELYSEKASALPEEEQTTQPFDLWFYASLGACDLGQINEETLPEPGQIEIIKTAIHNLPGPAAERHRGMFANGLFTRMSALNPAVKFRYAKYGLEIVGDHKQAQEARKVFDYYNDLVTEIKLEAAVDGSDVVSPQEPFGLFINLRHTREIERESGGFARYLQNQQNMMFAYNYGRPMANYRDKFEEAARKALEEHFEVLSVTFREPTVNSRATDEYGWRVTPYAYVLLKPRGPEVDKIPPLRLDLDFLDTSGYVILPIESNAVAIDASAAKPQARPYSKLTITQILDERQAAEGKLILEVKATAQGLVPPLEEILDVSPADFEVASTEDQGVAVSRFDPESEENVILSERTWAISMQAKNQQTERPREFRFAAPTVDVHEVVYNRYVDADLVAVDQQVLLEQKYGKTDTAWVWPALGGGVVILAAIVFWWRRPRRARAPSESRFQIPEELNAFTVLGLLNQIRTNNGLNDESRRELAASIARVERSYFANEPAEAPDLRQLAESWVQRAK